MFNRSHFLKNMHLPSLECRSSSIVRKKLISLQAGNDLGGERDSSNLPASEGREKIKNPIPGFTSNFEKYENIESHWRFSNSALEIKKSKEQFK